MSSLNRRFLVGLPSFLLLAACGAAPGDATSQSDEALGAIPVHIPPIFVAPEYYASGPSSPLVKMQSSLDSVCLLQGVAGQFDGWSSVARIITSQNHYYLQTSGGATATAACAPLVDFTGTGTSTISSTVNTPYYVSASHPQTTTGYTENKLGIWSGNSMCVLSGLAGDWTGFQTGPSETNPITQAFLTVGEAYVATNGPGIMLDADCFAFPQRSAVTQTLVYASVEGTPIVSLPNANVALCGFNMFLGGINDGPAVAITHGANGSQSLEIVGNVASAQADCMMFKQQGS